MPKIYSDLAIPPGEYLAEVLGIDINHNYADDHAKIDKFALKCGFSFEMLYCLLAGERTIEPWIAETLAKHTDVPAHIWTGLEEKYRETLRRNKEQDHE